MAFPLQADLESAITVIESALLEDRLVRNADAVYSDWRAVATQLAGAVSASAGYSDLDTAGVDFKGV